MKKLSFTLMLAVVLTTFLGSCSKEDAGGYSPKAKPNGNNTVPTELQQDTITNFLVYFSNPADESTQVGAYEDPDGPGPIEPCIGAVVLKANTQYIVTFMIEDATNKNKRVDIDNKIQKNGRDYKICISNPLGSSISAIDSDGLMAIGLENKLMTSEQTGNSSFNFSIKFQQGVKNGDCGPGKMYFSCDIPVSIYN
jgi:hypothetical protein